MDFLIGIALLVFSAIAAILSNLIANEFYDRTSSLARALIERAVLRLPKKKLSRFREEWLSHLG